MGVSFICFLFGQLAFDFTETKPEFGAMMFLRNTFDDIRFKKSLCYETGAGKV
jgi:hypothetical protein